jgi:PAS domain S-box-containing protein
MSGVVITEMIMDENGSPIDYVFLDVNKNFEKLTGLKAEEVIGKRVTEVYLGIEKRKNTFLDVHRKVALTGIPAEVEIYSEEFGRYFAINAYTVEKNIVAGVFQDVTERRIAEEKLKESEALLNEVGGIAKIGGWEYDVASGTGKWTPEVYKIHEMEINSDINVEDTFDYYPRTQENSLKKHFMMLLKKQNHMTLNWNS